MRILITTDAVGGVWQHSLSLARGLVELYRCRVLLVCFGNPDKGDLEDVAPGAGIGLVSIPVKLEWMPDSAADVAIARREVSSIVRQWHPDVVHCNQYCLGDIDVPAPVLIGAHSDVLGWVAWHRQDGHLDLDAIERDAVLLQYRDLVARGLGMASTVVCPSQFMAQHLDEIYGCPSEVIHNGLWPDLYESAPKRPVAVVAGRLWDEAKMAATALRAAEGMDLELRLIGPTEGPNGERASLPNVENAIYSGKLSWRETRQALSPAQFYLATSSYEPFGLSALEAALCGCTIVANDIPSFREIWKDTAAFYQRNDPDALRERLRGLLSKPAEAQKLAKGAQARAHERFTAQRMVARYYKLYQSV